MIREKVTERTFYPALMDVIRKAGGTAVQEISFNSQPDILFRINNYKWLLSVKIGEDTKTIKEGFIQYIRHKDEGNIKTGMLLLLPEFLRQIEPSEEEIDAAVQKTRVTTFIDTTLIKEEIRDRSFPKIINLLIDEVLPRLKRRERSYYSMPTVTTILQEQVAEMMREIKFDESTLLRIITDRNLLMDLGHLEIQQSEAVASFLASYILMSQILFFRLLYSERPEDFTKPSRPVSRRTLRKAFNEILDINYDPIYSIDVLNDIPSKFLKDTFDLIWGLEIENVRHDLPGQIFHKLMPSEIRKMLAAFYTRPQAAEILANLTISRSGTQIFDPACGSGTILTSAYKRKLELYKKEGRQGSPHRSFCEKEIFGADIMPFAVHLTTANLAAMDTSKIIKKTQIIQGDSLQIGPGKILDGGLAQLGIFPEVPTAHTIKGDSYQVSLKKVDSILMNPPFTKVERGIGKFIKMDRYEKRCGGEVGLWGHFIALADEFLKEDGVFGAVIPINALRGRESSKVRSILFNEWTPLYILKSTLNYGFSEWAEYRDILFIARKEQPSPNHKVKFCLVKKDLTHLTEDDTHSITRRIRKTNHLRSKDLDIDSHSLSKIQSRFENLMWFSGGVDFSYRDKLMNFIEKFSKKLKPLPEEYFLEGYRPVPKGVSKFLFLTRQLDDSRVAQAFLRFSSEDGSSIKVTSPLGASYRIEREALTPSLRTSVGLVSMNITNKWDYITHQKYGELSRVCRASGFKPKKEFGWDEFWKGVQNELKTKETCLVVSHRINPFSPSTYLNAFFSEDPINPSNQVNIIVEPDRHRAKATCVLLNSIFFLAQFFLLKEESTGRYINIRFYDLYNMNLYPPSRYLDPLVKVFKKFSKVRFLPLYNQFDTLFDERYQEFKEKVRKKIPQQRLWSTLKLPVKPSPQRLSFDLAVCKALGVSVSTKELIQLYEIFVKEMMIVRSLRRD